MQLNKAYLLVTPCKNEEDSLHMMIESVLSQSIKPAAWIIVNDGSTDGSKSIILSYCKIHSWIKILNLQESKRDSFFRYAQVCRVGFDYARECADKEKITYFFIGLVDADIILEDLLFEKLINVLENNERMGLVSGGIYYNLNGELKIEKNKELFGVPRLWKIQCFDDSGGYQLVNTPDVVSNIKCILHGWDTSQIRNAIAIQTRTTFSAEGLFKGWVKNGISQYRIGFPPIYALIKLIKYSFQKPYYKGIAYFLGYTSQLLQFKSRIDDKEVIHYNSVIRPRKAIKSILSSLKQNKNYF